MGSIIPLDCEQTTILYGLSESGTPVSFQMF